MKDYTWCYNKKSVPLSVKVEYLIKYGDLDEIMAAMNDPGSDYCKKIWIEKIVPDKRFDRLSYFLGRFVFNISTEKTEIMKFIRKHQKPGFSRN